jgi:hypothetical protein
MGMGRDDEISLLVDLVGPAGTVLDGGAADRRY